MKNFFPLCKNHPEIIYLDNAASTQKPQLVIDAMSDFMANEYANIHRGLYRLSEASEQHYHESKRLVAELL
jgi:cysteine desulfurase